MRNDPSFSLFEEEVSDFIRTPNTSDTQFEDLALRIHRFQRQRIERYDEYCRAWNTDPQSLADIVPLPALAFKRQEIRTFPSDMTSGYFQTSGTTESDSGRHYYQSLRLYRESAIPCFRRFVFPDVTEKIRTFSLTPSPESAPHSSLVCMIQMVMQEFGTTDYTGYFVDSDGTLHSERFLAAVRSAYTDKAPVLITTTAFSLVHFLDEMKRQQRDCPLPPGSRIMETGGFKGRSRELTRSDLYQQASECFGIPSASIVNEYGMTELFSQFYDVSLLHGTSTDEKQSMPWLRAWLVDPWTGQEVSNGPGVIKLVDLANVGSCIAVLTEDVGEWSNGRLRVLGRAPRTQMRGCSLAAESTLMRP